MSCGRYAASLRSPGCARRWPHAAGRVEFRRHDDDYATAHQRVG